MGGGGGDLRRRKGQRSDRMKPRDLRLEKKKLKSCVGTSTLESFPFSKEEAKVLNCTAVRQGRLILLSRGVVGVTSARVLLCFSPLESAWRNSSPPLQHLDVASAGQLLLLSCVQSLFNPAQGFRVKFTNASCLLSL